MRLTIKLIFILFFLLLASSLLLTPGCGKAITGSGTGGCPDSSAPDGSTITATQITAAPKLAGDCFPIVMFTVRDSGGNPLNGVCIEVYTNASIALHTGLADCHNVIASPQNAIVTRTDDSGNVVVELATPPTTTATTFSITAFSGNAEVVTTTPGAN
jgi:hypothetical protein